MHVLGPPTTPGIAQHNGSVWFHTKLSVTPGAVVGSELALYGFGLCPCRCTVASVVGDMSTRAAAGQDKAGGRAQAHT